MYTAMTGGRRRDGHAASCVG